MHTLGTCTHTYTRTHTHSYTHSYTSHNREWGRGVGLEQMMGRDSHSYTAFYPLSTQLIGHGTFLDLRNKMPGLHTLMHTRMHTLIHDARFAERRSR
jgi:hypothetical protein